MIAIGKIAFNEKDVQYVWWADRPGEALVVEFYDGNYMVIKSLELANIVWGCLVEHKTKFDAKSGEVEWVHGKGRVRSDP